MDRNMKLTTLLSAAAFVGGFASGAWAADYKVHHSLQVQDSAAEVWNLVGDFCDIDDWHPSLVGCSLKVVDGGLHRVLTATDGAEFIEKAHRSGIWAVLYLSHHKLSITG